MTINHSAASAVTGLTVALTAAALAVGLVGCAQAKPVDVPEHLRANIMALAQAPAELELANRIVVHECMKTHGFTLPVDTARILDHSRSISVSVSPGSAERIAPILARAIYPVDPGAVSLIVPPSPQKLLDQLTADARSFPLVVLAVTGGARLFGIITTMQISVWERRREIGLARALGMTRREIAASFLWESIALATVGTIVGWLLGVTISAAGNAITGWVFLLPIEILAIPVIGIAVGAVAGLLPACSAASIDPAELLRS